MTSPPSPLYGPVAYRLQLLAMIARSRLGSIGYPPRVVRQCLN